MKFKIPEDYNNLTLREIFQTLKVPKKDLHQLNMSKEITINNAPARLSNQVHTMDCVEIPTDEEKSNYLPSYRYAQIYYEDDDLAIVMKPKGVKKILDRMLEDNKITRIYKANVNALLPIKPQTIDMPIGKDKFHPNKRRISNTGQRAITHILASTMLKEGVCQLDIKLDTGRTHQIRVHLAEIGHPVIGDPLYGDSKLRKLELKSYQIDFVHPLTQQFISVNLDDNPITK